MKSRVVKADFKELNRFARDVSSNWAVRIGVFGSKNSRQESSGLTNAEIGASHEFGDPRRGLPQRSFLVGPINHEKDVILKDMKAKGAAGAIAKGKLELVLRNLGHACEAAIQRAFDSDGFGQWAPLSPSTISRKLRKTVPHFSVEARNTLKAQLMEKWTSGIVSILIDTAQLRRSIASKVVQA